MQEVTFNYSQNIEQQQSAEQKLRVTAAFETKASPFGLIFNRF